MKYSTTVGLEVVIVAVAVAVLTSTSRPFPGVSTWHEVGGLLVDGRGTSIVPIELVEAVGIPVWFLGDGGGWSLEVLG